MIRSVRPHSNGEGGAEAGGGDVADWVEAHGLADVDKPIAVCTPTERLIEARTGIPLQRLRADALAAWHATYDGDGFRAALRECGLDLKRGTAGPVVVDRTGTAHSLTRLIGAASRRATGVRIPAAAVKARVADLDLEEHGGGGGEPDDRGPDPGGNPGRAANVGHAAGGPAANARGTGATGSGELVGAHLGRPRESRLGPIRLDLAAAVGRLRALSPQRRALLAYRLSRAFAVRAPEDRRDYVQVEGAYDIWGVPLMVRVEKDWRQPPAANAMELHRLYEALA